MNYSEIRSTMWTWHRTKTNNTHNTEQGLKKNRGWTHVLEKCKQFLIRQNFILICV